jgi:hypothetical protein
MDVHILSRKMPGYLDTGSRITIGGNPVLKLVKENSIKVTPIQKVITFLKGSYTCEAKCSLKIKYLHGEKTISVYLLSDSVPTILLGRNFIGDADIGIFVGQSGWVQGPTNMQIIPFVNKPFNWKTDGREIELSPELVALVAESTIDDENIPTTLGNMGQLVVYSNRFSSGCRVPNPKENKESDGSNSEESDYEDYDSDDNDSDFGCEFFSSVEHVLANWEYFGNMDGFKPKQEKVPEIPIDPANPDFLSAPTYLTDEERNELRDLLNDFSDIFTKRPGLCKTFQHRISTGDAPPVVAHLRPISVGKRKLFDAAFNELLEYDVLEPAVNCPWSSTAFCVPKSDGSQRFVV